VETDEVRSNKPQVRDEIKNGLFYFRNACSRPCPKPTATWKSRQPRIRARTGGRPSHPGAEHPALRLLDRRRPRRQSLRHPDTTVLALRLQKREVLRHYLREVVNLSHVLTHSKRLCTISAPMAASLAQDEQRFAAVFGDYPQHFGQEPYRRKLYLMRHRLQHNLDAWMR